MNTTEQLKDLLYTNRILLANGLAAINREYQHIIDSNPNEAQTDSAMAIKGYIKGNQALLDKFYELITADDAKILESNS